MDKRLHDKWLEMAIREIWAQCQFAQLAFSNINLKAAASTDVVFSSIHSFLAHCANVSKLLDAKERPNEVFSNPRLKSIRRRILSALGFKRDTGGRSIGEILGIPKRSVIHRKLWFRNSLEHYDERLWTWLKTYGPNVAIFDYNVIPKNLISVPPDSKHIWVRNYDPTTKTFTFTDKDLDISEMHNEILDIQRRADAWVKKNVQAGEQRAQNRIAREQIARED